MKFKSQGVQSFLVLFLIPGVTDIVQRPHTKRGVTDIIQRPHIRRGVTDIVQRPHIRRGVTDIGPLPFNGFENRGGDSSRSSRKNMVKWYFHRISHEITVQRKQNNF